MERFIVYWITTGAGSSTAEYQSDPMTEEQARDEANLLRSFGYTAWTVMV